MIIVIKTISDMQKLRQRLKGTVGFVPTMGYLHEGHLSLVSLSKKENDHTIVSVFVNPKQFGPNDDFQKYPRDTERDVDLLKKVKTDIVFLPTVDELYPSDYETYVNLQTITQTLEGAIRLGHFTGVATILVKLFNIIHSTKAYFGQKDAQQVAVVKKLVKDLNMPLHIIVGETVRESDGLAMSSRNVFLNQQERKEAVVLYQSLCLAKELYKKGEKKTLPIKKHMEKLIQKTQGKIDYISFADAETLEEILEINKTVLVSLAVRFGKTRLIDNINV